VASGGERFVNLARNDMPDKHAWVSVLYRHKGSAFTSAERTLICFLLLVANAACGLAWYRSTDSGSGDDVAVRFVYKLIVALITSAIVFAGTFPLVLLFRGSRSFSATGGVSTAAQKAKTSTAAIDFDAQGDSIKEGAALLLPHEAAQWPVALRLLGWAVTVLATLGCLAVCALYTHQLKVQNFGLIAPWLQSFAISVVESRLLSQPLMVLAVAAWKARSAADPERVESMLRETDSSLAAAAAAGTLPRTGRLFGGSDLAEKKNAAASLPLSSFTATTKSKALTMRSAAGAEMSEVIMSSSTLSVARSAHFTDFALGSSEAGRTSIAARMADSSPVTSTFGPTRFASFGV
jgi:hypothetical protein